MRTICFLSFAWLSVWPAAAETRTFVIVNAPDGYGVDQCLATGARCGILVANAYCQSQDFDRASSFRRVDGPEVTGTVVPQVVSASDRLVAIECAK
jgi:hypothetical protein